MKRGNILVIGNSGVGKSTLINAVIGSQVAKTGWGTEGTSSHLQIYESDNIHFRIIDTVGFEPSFFKTQRAINAVKKWSNESTKAGKEDSQINVIWFCVEGTSSKLFPSAITNLSKATSMWKSVPVIVVITKSYSIPDRKDNIKLVQNAFAQMKKYGRNLRDIIPVVADTYHLNDTTFVAPDGITELIDATEKLMPEGIDAARMDIETFKLKRKKTMSQSLVWSCTIAGATIGAVPFPIPDALIDSFSFN